MELELNRKTVSWLLTIHLSWYTVGCWFSQGAIIAGMPSTLNPIPKTFSPWVLTYMPKHVGFHVKALYQKWWACQQEALVSGIVLDSLGLILHAKTCYWTWLLLFGSSCGGIKFWLVKRITANGRLPMSKKFSKHAAAWLMLLFRAIVGGNFGSKRWLSWRLLPL